MYKIVCIEDTRSWDWNIGKPIHGSGCQRPCDHCGKTHDVIVTLHHFPDNKRMDVGTSCAKKLSAYGLDIDTKGLWRLARIQQLKELAQKLWNELGRLTFSDEPKIDEWCVKNSTDALQLKYGVKEELLVEYHRIAVLREPDWLL